MDNDSVIPDVWLLREAVWRCSRMSNADVWQIDAPLRYSWLTWWAALLLVLMTLGCNRHQRLASEGTDGNASVAVTGEQAEADSATAISSLLAERLELGEFRVSLPENPGYVGYEACRPCHAERVAECESTPHFLTCRFPERERMPRAFFSDNVRERELGFPSAGITFRMATDGNRFTQTAIDHRSGTVREVESTIDLVYGAKNTSDEVYLSWHPDGQMRELPVAWVHAKNAWGASGFDRLGSGDFGRELTVRCFECHNTWFQHVPGTLGTYTRTDFLPGVTCERCHGPGKQHVEYHQKHPSDLEAHHIVYPGALSRERLLDVCLQCHSNSIRHKGPPLQYRPGEPLGEYYRFVHPRFDEDDHVADQISDLQRSKCFLGSDMTCVTCHDPHHTSAPAGGVSYRDICLECHRQPQCQHAPDIPPAVRHQCTDCHMRHYVKINVNFDLQDDSYVPPLQRSQHYIAIDSIGTRETILRWLQSQSEDSQARVRAAALQRELVEHWLSEADRLSDQGRHLAAIAAVREALRLAPDDPQAQQRLQRYIALRRKWDDLWTAGEHAMRDGAPERAMEMFAQIIELSPIDALAYGRLGTLRFHRGERQTAVELWQRCSQMDPDEQYGISMQAWEALTRGDPATAARLYEQADSIEPFNSQLNTLWARALLGAGQIDKAVERLQVALQSDPRNLEAMRYLVAALLQSGDAERAVQPAEDAVRLTNHQNVEDLMILAEVYLRTAQPDRARAAAATALALVAGRDDRVAQEIEHWLISTRLLPTSD